MDANEYLLDPVEERVSNLDSQTVQEWGGVISDGTPSVSPVVNEDRYSNHTSVDSVTEAIAAFEKYTEYFEWLMDNWSPSAENLVLVPCGSQKPIGSSSIHQKKVSALEEAGYLSDSDLVIMSEPCTVIPHEYRLSLPAVNYDFPPEYTEEGRADEVFDIFVDRLVEWLEACEYDAVYPYLVSRHMNKFTTAVERMRNEPTVVEIPGASYNPDSDSYSGDLFKSQEDIVSKLRAVRAVKGSGSANCMDTLCSESKEFYLDRWD